MTPAVRADGAEILIIPAAGRGSRLGSASPKALVPVNGRSMLEHLLRLYAGVVERYFVVVAPEALAAARRACDALSYEIELVVQPEPTGMLDAILVPHERIQALRPRRVWVTWCDQVAVHPATVARLAAAGRAEPEPALALPTAWRREPYIHFERDEHGRIARVLQRREGDALPDVGESDVGLFSFSGTAYLRLLPAFAGAVRPAPATGERNFLPFVPWMRERGDVVTVPATHAMESVGINTPAELDRVAAYLRGDAAAVAGGRA